MIPTKGLIMTGATETKMTATVVAALKTEAPMMELTKAHPSEASLACVACAVCVVREVCVVVVVVALICPKVARLRDASSKTETEKETVIETETSEITTTTCRLLSVVEAMLGEVVEAPCVVAYPLHIKMMGTMKRAGVSMTVDIAAVCKAKMISTCHQHATTMAHRTNLASVADVEHPDTATMANRLTTSVVVEATTAVVDMMATVPRVAEGTAVIT